jgi:hypothetical protein
MEVLVWAPLAQWVVVLVIIAAAFVLPEPRYVDYMRSGPWTAEKSAHEANNRLIYVRRFVRHGVGVGLAFGLVAGAVTWLVGMIR